MSSETWWNQLTLPCPATGAQKIDISRQDNIKHLFERLLSEVSKCKTALNECLTILESELVLFNRFLYKLHAVFKHDKGYKVLKQIQKSLFRFKQLNIQELITHFQEQHCLSSMPHKFVAPRPVYDYLLIRIQGGAKLLSQMLCYCHMFGSIVLQKLGKGHFININIISMSFSARLWILSLQLVNLFIKLHKHIRNALENQDILPASIVQFLPPGVSIERDLRAWLTNDESLANIHALIRPLDIKSSEVRRGEIWNSYTLKSDDEKRHFEELKFLVETNTEVAQTELKDTLEKRKTKSCDVGVLVSREGSLPTNNKAKKNRTKKRKRNQMEK